MIYPNVEKEARQTGTMTRLNGGSVRLLGAAAQVIAQAALNTPSGTVNSAGLITMAGFPKSVAPLITNVPIAKAVLVDSAGVVRGDDMSVGLAGSGAEVIVSKLTPAPGDTVTIAAPFTIADL